MATVIEVNGINIHYKLEGPENGPTIVFSNSLGTDMRIWDEVISVRTPFFSLRYPEIGTVVSLGAFRVGWS